MPIRSEHAQIVFELQPIFTADPVAAAAVICITTPPATLRIVGVPEDKRLAELTLLHLGEDAVAVAATTNSSVPLRDIWSKHAGGARVVIRSRPRRRYR